MLLFMQNKGPLSVLTTANAGKNERQGPSSRFLRRRKGSKVGELGLKIELDPAPTSLPP